MSGLKPKTFRQLSEEQVEAIPADAFAGMTKSVAKRLNRLVALSFASEQIKEISAECLDAMKDPIFRLLEDDLSSSQLNGLENL